MEARINAAVQLEANVSSQSQSAREKEDAQNEFQKRINETLKKMDDAANWKEYALNRVTLEAICLLYTSPSPRDGLLSRMPSSA